VKALEATYRLAKMLNDFVGLGDTSESRLKADDEQGQPHRLAQLQAALREGANFVKDLGEAEEELKRVLEESVKVATQHKEACQTIVIERVKQQVQVADSRLEAMTNLWIDGVPWVEATADLPMAEYLEVQHKMLAKEMQPLPLLRSTLETFTEARNVVCWPVAYVYLMHTVL
jgi:hypothetical protein